ncbi:MAG: hypothetical protein KF774_03965 [Planctomyces sp.]|nr:hypothetical protein [Planctomyces sp.]
MWQASRRVAAGIALAACLWSGTGSADDAPRTAALAIPAETLLRIDASRLADIVRVPAVEALSDFASASALFAPLYENPEAFTAREALLFLERRLELDRDELWERLAGGRWSFAVLPGAPPLGLIAIDALDPDLPGRILQLMDELASRSAAGTFETSVYRDFDCRRYGKLALAIQGPRILLSGDRQILKEAVDRLQDADATANAPAAADEFEVHARVDLARLRLSPEVQAGLKWPPDDLGAIAILGGWLDLFRQYDRIDVSLSQPDSRLLLDVRFTSPAGTKVQPGLEGFWAPEGSEAPPLLMPTGVLYASSWHRDYQALWEARETLIGAERAERVTKADADAGAQMQVVGAEFTPSDLLSQLGPEFRTVILHSTPPYADVVPPNRLPAGVAVVSLRDESRVRTWMSPVFRILNLILNGDQGIISTAERHGDAELTILSLPTKPEALRRGSLDRFNFRTTYTISRGRFVIGTTPAAVKAVLDVLDAEAALPAGGLAASDSESPLRVTDRQSFSPAELARALNGVAEALGRSLVLVAGLTVDEAERETERLQTLFGSLGRIETSAGFGPDGFQYRVQWFEP